MLQRGRTQFQPGNHPSQGCIPESPSKTDWVEFINRAIKRRGFHREFQKSPDGLLNLSTYQCKCKRISKTKEKNNPKRAEEQCVS